MSVINQVLNQLEQRGAHGAAEQPMVRAVLNQKRDYAMPLLVAVLVLIVGIATWQWVLSRKLAVITQSVAIKNYAASSNINTDNSTLPKQFSVPISDEKSGIPAQAVQVDTLVPASRLSFELSSAMLPTTPQSHEQTKDARSSEQSSKGDTNKSADLKQPKPGELLSTSRSQPISIEKTNPSPTITAQSTIGSLPIKKISAAQQADAEFRHAAGLMQMGRIADAVSGYEAALALDASHDAARQALVALLLEGKRNADAEKVLLDGLDHKPDHAGFTMLLARLQVERGALEQATATLEKSLPFADAQVDYRAFLAALLQRQNRNEDAIKHYQIVLQHAPNNAVWLMGYGISLQALQRNAEAKNAFQRAFETKTLSPELQAFVQQKLKGL